MEILIALVIAGMLAAFSLPSLLSLLSGNEVKSAQDQVQSALRDAQRSAIRRSQSCSVTIDISSDPVVIDPTTTDDAECLSSSDRQLPKGIQVTSSRSGDRHTFKYSFKGHTTNAQTLTFSSPNTNQERCLAISMHLGIMRAGVKDSEGNCVTSSSTL